MNVKPRKRRLLILFAISFMLLSIVSGCAPTAETPSDKDIATEEQVVDEDAADAEPAEQEEASEQETEEESAVVESKDGGTLIVAMDAEADILDATSAGGWITWRVNRNMFDTLVMEDLTKEDVEMPPRIPGLAEEWNVSEDGLEWTFNLREGVTFHDGTPFNAEAVKWNIERMSDEDVPHYSAKAASCTASTWQNLESIEVVDDSTIKLYMDKPFGEFIGTMLLGGCGNTAMMSPASWEKWGDEVGEHPAGTGPFKFVERVRGEKIVLERWDDYWGAELGGPYQAPHIDRLIFVPMPDAAARIAALEAGEVDMVWSPPPDSVPVMVDKGFTLSVGPTPHLWYWNLNLREPCLDDVKVRQAINYAIDRESLAHDLLKDTVLPAYTIVAPGGPVYDPDYKPYEYDLNQAKQLLAESSCPDGFTTKWLVPTGGSGNITPVPIAEWIQRDLSAIGVDVELETYEWQTYLGFWWKGIQEGEGAYMMSWGAVTPYFIDIAAHSKWFAPDGSNIGWYKNPDVDALLDQAMVEVDDESRYDLYIEANKLIAEDAAFVVVVHDSAPYLLSPRVKDFPHAPQEWMDFRTVWLDE
jgi:peptide/nickel transport system substrate-binding protein